MDSLGPLRPSVMQQNLFVGKPQFTEKNIGDLAGKVYIVTGSNTGVGKELARILYTANATVHLACRTESKAQSAITSIQSAAPNSSGALHFLPLDLGDLSTIRAAAEAFAAKSDRLDVLFNNAGVMAPPEGSKTAQGYEMQLGTNCLGHFAFTQLLTPVLKQTAAKEPKGSVRVVWVSSIAAELCAIGGGFRMSLLDETGKNYAKQHESMVMYAVSKVGNYLHSVEYARRHKDDGIVSVAANPGNLDSDLYRTVNSHSGVQAIGVRIFSKFMLHPQVNGAYTELFAGLSPDVTMEKTGSWIGPWGRFFDMRKDIRESAKPTSEGGKGTAAEFWKWSEDHSSDVVSSKI